MSRYIVKRLLYLIPMLFCVVLLIFLIMALTTCIIIAKPQTNVKRFPQKMPNFFIFL